MKKEAVIMIREVNIKTSIEDYKKNKNNHGKVAVFDIDNSEVIYEGNEEDWLRLRLIVEEANVENEIYHLIIVPISNAQIRSFNWG